MSASLDRDLAAVIERGAESVARRYGKRAPVTFSKGRGTVEAVNADGTLDVAYQGAVLQSVLSTTACANVKVKDSVLLEFFDARAYATGVIATENVRYVKPDDVADAVRSDPPLRIYTSTVVVIPSNDSSYRVWTMDQFAEKYGAYAVGRTFVAFMNGDGNANGAHVDGCTVMSDGIYAVFDRVTSNAIRINCLVVN